MRRTSDRTIGGKKLRCTRRAAVLAGCCFLVAVNSTLSMLPAAYAKGPMDLLPELDSEVIASRNDATVTRAELDWFMEQRIPAEDRAIFLNDLDRLEKVIEDLLVSRLLAREYLADRVASDVGERAGLRTAMVDYLAKARRDQLIESAQDADLEQIARERYLARKDRFRDGPKVGFTQIFLEPAAYDPDEAESVAVEIREALDKDISFEKLVMRRSEEPGVRAHEGKYDPVPLSRLDPEFRTQLEGLQPGEISDMFRTQHGWHMVRIDTRQPARQKPFEEVRESLIREVRNDLAADRFDRHVKQMLGENPAELNSNALDEFIEHHSKQAASPD